MKRAASHTKQIPKKKARLEILQGFLEHMGTRGLRILGMFDSLMMDSTYKLWTVTLLLM